MISIREGHRLLATPPPNQSQTHPDVCTTSCLPQVPLPTASLSLPLRGAPEMHSSPPCPPQPVIIVQTTHTWVQFTEYFIAQSAGHARWNSTGPELLLGCCSWGDISGCYTGSGPVALPVLSGGCVSRRNSQWKRKQTPLPVKGRV